MATRSSCTRYITAYAAIHFPEDEGARCSLCPCLETYSRKQCRLTGEYLADGYLIGGMCPLNIIEREESKNGNPCVDSW